MRKNEKKAHYRDNQTLRRNSPISSITSSNQQDPLVNRPWVALADVPLHQIDDSHMFPRRLLEPEQYLSTNAIQNF